MDDETFEFPSYAHKWNVDPYDWTKEFLFAVIASTERGLTVEENKTQRLLVLKAQINDNDYAGVSLLS